jgi:DNA-binding MarR family transcriptional regulator
MVKRLIQLGLVIRCGISGDRRMRMVRLTPRAVSLIDDAVESVHHGSSALTLAANSAIAPLRWFDRAHCLKVLRRTNGTLRRYALTFGDTALPLYAPVAA